MESLSIWLIILPFTPYSFYSKMPDDIAERWVLLLDPMLGKWFILYLSYT